MDELFGALGLDTADLGEAMAELEADAPAVAVLLEPMLGVTLTPTMISASQKVNVVPSHARLDVDCRVPPELGEEAARAAVVAAIGEDGYRLAFHGEVMGNRSAHRTRR